MGGSFGPAHLLIDPAVSSRLPEVRRALDREGVAFEAEELADVGEARPRAGELLRDGERFLVAVGGDDVVHEVVNGLFEGGAGNEPPLLGVLAAGTDNEFLRQFGIPLDVDKATVHLTGGGTYPIDVGVVTARSADGSDTTRHFANVGAVGLSAAMAARARPSRSRVGLFLAFWAAVLGAKRASLHVDAARKTYDGRAYDVVIGNGKFGPGGFRVSPRSFPGDGILDVLIHHGPKSQAFTSLPKAAKGEQVPSPHITELRANVVSVDADPSLPVAVDGRPVGTTPAKFRLLPRALRLKI